MTLEKSASGTANTLAQCCHSDLALASMQSSVNHACVLVSSYMTCCHGNCMDSHLHHNKLQNGVICTKLMDSGIHTCRRSEVYGYIHFSPAGNISSTVEGVCLLDVVSYVMTSDGILSNQVGELGCICDCVCHSSIPAVWGSRSPATNGGRLIAASNCVSVVK